MKYKNICVIGLGYVGLQVAYYFSKKYNCLVFVDDCHATGFVGKNGKGTQEALNVMGKVDVITGTLGKALGGGSGGFTSGKKEIIEILRQKSRPYLFSNTLAPSIVGASLAVLDVLEKDSSHLRKLKDNTTFFREEITRHGFEIKPGTHPIVPIMLYDDHLAQNMSKELLTLGVYVIGFFYPVVPRGQARIRVQISAAHAMEDIQKAIDSFVLVGKKLKVI